MLQRSHEINLFCNNKQRKYNNNAYFYDLVTLYKIVMQWLVLFFLYLNK